MCCLPISFFVLLCCACAGRQRVLTLRCVCVCVCSHHHQHRRHRCLVPLNSPLVRGVDDVRDRTKEWSRLVRSRMFRGVLSTAPGDDDIVRSRRLDCVLRVVLYGRVCVCVCASVVGRFSCTYSTIPHSHSLSRLIVHYCTLNANNSRIHLATNCRH